MKRTRKERVYGLVEPAEHEVLQAEAHRQRRALSSLCTYLIMTHPETREIFAAARQEEQDEPEAVES